MFTRCVLAALKAASHSVILRACMGAIKDIDKVLPAKKRPALHVVVIIPLNVALCRHPMHENR